MKNIILTILLLVSTATFAQSAKEMLAEIEGQYELDDLGHVTYTKVIEIQGVSRDEMYNRAKNYFIYRYGSGKAVIQTEDKEKGTIVGKGIYPKVHIGTGMYAVQFDTWHILRIDVKEGKARILISLTDYEITTFGTRGSSDVEKAAVGSLVPFKDKGPYKVMAGKAFSKSHLKAKATFDELERALKEGVTGGKRESEDW